jgi:hypothetical protein
MKDGTSVFKITGSDGFTMERQDIQIECLRRVGSQRQVKT